MFEPPEAKRYVNRKPLLSHPIQPSTPSHPQTNQSKSTNSILYSVRRDEILSRTSTSPSSSPPPESTFQDGQQRLAELLNLDSLIAAPETTTTRMTQDDTNKPAEEGKEGEEDEEQEFEFRLFSAPVSRKTADTASKPHVRDDGEVQTGKGKDDNQAGTQKLCIRLRSPTPGPADLSEGRFVNPFRGWGYYFTRPELLSGSRSQGIAGEDECADAALKRKQFEDAAVSGQHILGWALQPWVSLIPFHSISLLSLKCIYNTNINITSPAATSPGESSISNATKPNCPKIHPFLHLLYT